MTRLMNELINDEAVYRTSPATPGLLNKFIILNLNNILPCTLLPL